MAPTYAYRPTFFGPRTVEPAVVVAEVSRLDRAGGVTPEGVVALATPEDAPLHPAFLWDNDEAAHEHRLWQARQLIRAVVRLPDPTDKEQDSVRVFVQVPSETKGGGVYRPLISLAVERPDEYERALGELERKVAMAQASLAELRQHAGTADELADADTGLEVARTALRKARARRKQTVAA
jgi:hypothetical protein